MRIINKAHSKLEYRVRSLTPKRVCARLKGPTIVANSIPKGGTHLLTRCLMLFPTLSYAGLHYTRGISDVHTIDSYLRKTGKGRFMAAHLWWSEDCARLFRERSIISILMIRDPRDVTISGVLYILNRKEHHLHEYFESLPDMNARINAYICGVDSAHSREGIGLANIRKSFDHYIPWVYEKSSLLTRFEDLIGPKGGGNSDNQRKEIKKMAAHLGESMTDDIIASIAESIFSVRSVTFRKGAMGGWREYYIPQQKKLFKEVAGDLLLKLGYEKSSDW